jgi:NAD+ synthase
METLTTNLNYTAVADGAVEWLRSYADSAGAKGFVMGVSGGIDSAVVSTLVAKTGLSVLILEMPIHQGKDQVTRAKDHIQWLKDNYSNVTSREIDLTSTYDALYGIIEGTMPEGSFDKEWSRDVFDFSAANSRSRLRMTTLYHVAGVHKMLVAGTGNKVEDFGIGFYTKYGDGGVDVSPIADLMKSEVYALGRELGVIESILTAAPTDGLHDDGRTDEDQIGATYDELEWAMKNHETLSSIEDPYLAQTELERLKSTWSERQNEVYKIFIRFNNSNRHKMNPIPVFDTSKYRG